MIEFTVYGIAQPAGSKRGFHNAKTGRTHVVDANAKSRSWKAQVADAAVQAMCDNDGIALPLLDGPLMLELAFYVPRPKGHYGTGKNSGSVKASAPPLPITKPDVLKLARGVEDALTGIVYRDDAQIASEVLAKRYGEPARVEVRVHPQTDKVSA